MSLVDLVSTCRRQSPSGSAWRGSAKDHVDHQQFVALPDGMNRNSGCACVPIDSSGSRLNSSNLTAVFVVIFVSLGSSAVAQQKLKEIPPPDPQIELDSFQVADEFNVNLFAADPIVRKPVQMAFDAEGRLWVASPSMYPQIRPGDEENDRIVVIEDRDGDGVSDDVRVFADGLMMPTGILPGDGGIYVAHGNELIHLADTDGDGAADQRRIVLDGFGTEDTHHVLHSLRWGPDGMIYMHQSYYIASHVETPYGVRRMNGGGIWQFDTRTGRLEPYMHGMVNSWGLRFDQFGQTFATDGAGNMGINHVFPGATMLATPHSSRVLPGLNPGSPKHSGLEMLSGRAIPDSWQGRLITADFRSNRINSFEISENGSSFASQKREDLIASTHVAFRPVDMTMGPDGAIYIADWYSPIIQHGEVDFKDPRRDRVHGRIWRMTAKARPVLLRPQIVDVETEQVVDLLASPEDWTRYQARRRLHDLAVYDEHDVIHKLNAWAQQLPDSFDGDQLRLEALWVNQTIRHIDPDLLRRLLKSVDPRVRAGAVRVLSLWQSQISDSAALLAAAVGDEHPRVRLEAVLALGKSRSADAAVVAMRALKQPSDEFLDFAMWRSVRRLSAFWLPALESGKIDFGGDVSQQVFALQAVESPDAATLLIDLIASKRLSLVQEQESCRVVAGSASPAELRRLLDMALADDPHATALRPVILESLLQAAEQRRIQPAGDLSEFEALLHADADPSGTALKLAGQWQLTSARSQLSLALVESTSAVHRQAAADALVMLGQPEDRAILEQAALGNQRTQVRIGAATALVRLNTKAAAGVALQLLKTLPTTTDVTSLFAAFLEQRTGPMELTAALKDQSISADFARLGVRACRATAQSHADLIGVISRAGGIENTHRVLSGEELTAFLKSVQQNGDAIAGEAVFRRSKQSCLTCHSIAGAGGRVGPDLMSVGASAPLDYIVDSMLDPNKKIKENFTSLVVLTDEGRVYTGLRVRQNRREVIIRTTNDEEISIPVASIEEQSPGGSLMPVGLVDDLTDTELRDLIRFLSELGKPGPYSVGPRQFVRRWQIADNIKAAPRETIESVIAKSDRVPRRSVYSTVAGVLPLSEVANADSRSLLASFDLEVTMAGPLAIHTQVPESTTIAVDADRIALSDIMTFEATKGTHTISVWIPHVGDMDRLQLEVVAPQDSAARFQLIGGK